MGIFDALRGKRELAGQEEKEHAAQAEGKYNEPCSLCGAGKTEKKWMGQYWHKKCLRAIRKGAKGMI